MPRVGELVQATDGRFIVYAPRHCPNGHPLRPGHVRVGFQPCGGEDRGGHLTWTCDCNATVNAPEFGPVCEVLHGPAKVRG
jgi:hypothetical protein